MKRDLKKDLAQLEPMAFGRLRHCGPLLERFHAMSREIEQHQQRDSLERLYDWLLTPFMLWPHDFEGMANEVLKQLAAGRVDADLLLLLEQLEEPPPEKTRRVIADFERDIESGRYDRMLKPRAKYEEAERRLLSDKRLRAAWRKIKSRFDVKQFQNPAGVTRRRVSGERNFREGWKFDWSKERNRFQELLDALCYRSNLYGMQKDKPLLLKVSVNPTPHGTLIFIPRFLSFDPKRDLDWGMIAALHRCRVGAKQGPKLSSARMERLQEAQRARALWAEAGRKGQKGAGRYEYVRERMGRLEQADPGWLWRLLRA
jgi:hypothetical protein